MSPGAGSVKSRSGQGWEPPGKTRRLTLPQTEEDLDSHSISDTANASSNGEEAQGTASGSTNQLLNHNTQ